MIYLRSFRTPTPEEDENAFYPLSGSFIEKNRQTCRNSVYPFVLFRTRGLPEEFTFGDITVLCGANGSGKSTLLNLIAEKLGLHRAAPYNRSDYFEDYTALCDYKTAQFIPAHSAILTSDDVFDRMLDIRRVNAGVDDAREELLREWRENRYSAQDMRLRGLEDYDRWKALKETKKKRGTASGYVNKRLARNIEEHSNGESALELFVNAIKDDALYLLDEPENSLSPARQLELKYFLEDCVRHHGCQFIISTHSPFLLALKGARVYDLDHAPVTVKKWTELECVEVYRSFFRAVEENGIV